MARTRAMTSMMFAPGCRRMKMSTAGRRSPIPRVVVLDVIVTRPISWRRTAGPVRYARPWSELLGAEELIVGRQRVRLIGAAERTLGLIDRRLLEGFANVRHPEPHPRERRRVDLYANGGLNSAPVRTWPTPGTCEIF